MDVASTGRGAGNGYPPPVRKHLLVLAAIALVSIALAWSTTLVGGPSRPRTALGTAPADAAAVIALDARAILESPLAAAILGDGDAGLERIERACGFDPLERLRSVVVVVLGGEERALESVGFVARGDLPREDLARCVADIVAEDGGQIRRVEIEGLQAIASERGDSRAAFLGDDGVVGGNEAIVRRLIRVDRGREPGAEDDPMLSRLWQRVRARGDLMAVARIPPNWRAWLGRFGDQGGLDAIDTARGIGIGARVREGLGVTIAIESIGAAEARTLATAVRAQIDAALALPLVRLSAAGDALRAIELGTSESDVIATLDLDALRLAAVVDIARTMLDRARRGGLDGALDAAPPSSSAREREEEAARSLPPPDETHTR
jgi:hypothetical protein